MIKRTLIITLEFPPHVGGIASFVSDFAAALPGSEIVVLAPWYEEQIADGRVYRVIRKRLLFPKFLWPRWARLVWHVFVLVKKEKIERIIVHHALPTGYVGVMMKRVFHIPFLLFCHGTDVTVAQKSRWKKRMFSMVANEAAVVVLSSRSLEERFLAAFPNIIRERVIVYACPSQVFYEFDSNAVNHIRNQYGLLGKKVLLSAGRVVPGKGFLTIARLLPDLVKRIPNLVWVVIGTGRELPRIENEIAELSLQNMVRFVGDVPHNELSFFFHAADVFGLMTHPFHGREEGLGLVFLEAAAAGVPAVAGRSGGVAEAIIHGKTGLVVDPDSDQEILDALLLLLINESYAKELASAARERVAAEFQWPHQAEKVLPYLV